jgi:hypothetical protein
MVRPADGTSARGDLTSGYAWQTGIRLSRGAQLHNYKEYTSMEQKKKISALTAFALASALALTACGGGGGGGNSGASGTGNSSSGSGSGGSSSGSSTATGNVSTPVYTSASAQSAVFNTINAKRQACGFPALTENTLLDKSSQAHADYIGANGGTITDSEISTNTGYTGANYATRATAAGYPASTVDVFGESAGYWTNSTLSEADYGTGIANAWSSGVYHVGAFVWPVTQIGIGWNETSVNNYPEAHGVITVTNLQPMSGSFPLMFPCDGATNVPYQDVGETPTPPNSNGTLGPTLAVSANSADTVTLTSGTLTDSSGNVITLQVLNSATDTNKLIQKYEARAYPASPLLPNTKYSAVLSGTYNGTPFTRTGSFTTKS